MLKIGVIGVGNMGRNHVRNILELPQYYEFVGCYDESEDNVNVAKERFGVTFFDDVQELLKKTDAISIAVPSSLHLEYGLLAAKHKNHALIEKPLALSTEDANILCEAFSKTEKTLMVGHIERFNPVVSVMKDILKNEQQIIVIEARRCGPFNPRISDTNVVFDLMIHDIDIVLNYLYPDPVASVQASAVIAKSKTHSDYVQAMFQHESGVISTIQASRITEDKIRAIDIHTTGSLIRGDLLNQTLFIFRKTNLSPYSAHSSMYTQENVIEKVVLPITEPLKRELIEFAEAIRDGREALTNGKDATQALYFAERVQELTENSPKIS